MKRLLTIVMMAALLAITACAATAPRPQVATLPLGPGMEKIQRNMTGDTVVGILGQPTKTADWYTGKALVPFYHGSDTRRVAWDYEGRGRIIFTRARWPIGSYKVLRVEQLPVDEEVSSE
ncbi:MAG: hypothetical protein OEY01_10790 [Desulfobulbaceae bacterium]|nr:hypothetical protein [Desulfobulbaceae bacterium]